MLVQAVIVKNPYHSHLRSQAISTFPTLKKQASGDPVACPVWECNKQYFSTCQTSDGQIPQQGIQQAKN